MLQNTTLTFLKDLKKNNNKPWFDINRKRYQAAKDDFASFVGHLITATAKQDATIANLEVKQCVFRINKDIRFSKDKSPYKTNMGTSLNKGAKKIAAAGYYLHVEPGQSFVAGGMYMPDATQLAKIRQEIDYNLPAFKKIVTNKKIQTLFNGLSKEEGVLVRPPKGYEADNPAIEYLKHKHFIFTMPLPDSLLTHTTLVTTIANYFKTMQPLIYFLNAAMEE
jgi:uncharacterized protein (TIGR02453 family)